MPEFAEKAFGKRPAEEFYLAGEDHFDWENVAADPRFGATKAELAARLDEYLAATGDPRATGEGELLDEVMRRFPRTGMNAADAEQSR